jgi:hypothetical protein
MQKPRALTMPLASSPELLSLAMDHASGKNAEKLKQLQERFEGFSICKSKATAAAFGYLLAQQEKEKEEEIIYDQLCAVLDEWKESDDSAVEEQADLIMGLIYIWLKEEFIADDFTAGDIDWLKAKFQPYCKPSLIV